MLLKATRVSPGAIANCPLSRATCRCRAASVPSRISSITIALERGSCPNRRPSGRLKVVVKSRVRAGWCPKKNRRFVLRPMGPTSTLSREPASSLPTGTGNVIQPSRATTGFPSLSLSNSSADAEGPGPAASPPTLSLLLPLLLSSSPSPSASPAFVFRAKTKANATAATDGSSVAKTKAWSLAAWHASSKQIDAAEGGRMRATLCRGLGLLWQGRGARAR
mmetsp:Transcript_10598/g.27196  ORF Transcript_10598/g.27196 Transcript_10598/m.27196 type:complete len:221 (-) Transcript_10598:95-757(-)